MRIEIASLKAIKYACINFHYSKCMPVSPFGLSCFNDNNEWIGCIVFSLGANNNAGKPYNLSIGEIIELTRIAFNGKQECTSKYLSKSLKLLKIHLPLTKLIVSYADIDQNHIGTIYQATNWFYVGETMTNSKDGSWLINGKRIHSKTISSKCGGRTLELMQKFYKTNDIVPYTTKGKRKYLYPLDKRLIPMLKGLVKPYPKKTIQEVI